MPAKNQRQGVPKPFSGLVRAQFPLEKPIFWGGNQDTERGFDYVEPDAPRSGLMRIPLCIRFVVGGQVTDVFINRYIYLGWFSAKKVAYSKQDVECSPITFTLGGEHYLREAVHVVTEIATAYGANMSTEDAINIFGRTQRHNGGGDVFGMLSTTSLDYQTMAFMYTCGINPTVHYAPNYISVPGLGAIGPEPIFVAPALVFSTTVANPYIPYAATGQTISGHYFLLNLIIGDFQLNRLAVYWTETFDGQLTEPLDFSPFGLLAEIYPTDVLELAP